MAEPRGDLVPQKQRGFFQGMFWGGSGGDVASTVTPVKNNSAFGDAKDAAGELVDPTQDYQLTQRSYNFNHRVFPHGIDSEVADAGHYMVINISVPNASKFATVHHDNSNVPHDGPARSEDNQLFTRLGSGDNRDLSKTDALRFAIDGTFTNDAGNSLVSPFGTRPRFSTRIEESIALYMPNSTLLFSDKHDYQELSMTGVAKNLAKGVAGVAASFIGGVMGIAGSVAGSAAGGVFDSIGNVIDTTAKVTGNPINPKIEVIFKNTVQREFTFEFMFSPSDDKEAADLRQIIRTIRLHAAPELRPGAVDSFFYVSPSEFDITFYNKGVENTMIPRINTCVLQNIEVDYAPEGQWATFHDGQPVLTTMRLHFREVEINHRLRVLQGF